MDLKILHIDDKCTGCGACANICPKRCIEIIPNSEGFYYPVYNEVNCIECKLCENVCHVISSEKGESILDEGFYMYYSHDDEIRKVSSSGGVFSLFANYIISQGGVVFGSKYNWIDERLEVSNTDECSLSELRKSKYIESHTLDSFSKIKYQLLNSRKVLYCGTPCQVRGLIRFLSVSNTCMKDLITIDFACHGVPSNMCFTEFKRKYERKQKIVGVDFRYKNFNKKNSAWHNLVLKLDFSRGRRKILPYRVPFNLGFYRPFEDSVILRLCCFSCDYFKRSKADISIGDFWGIYKYKPELDNNKGISFVKMHNNKYLELWEDLVQNTDCYTEKLPYSAVSYIYNKKDKTLLIDNRNAFFIQIRKVGYNKAVKNYYKKEIRYYYKIGWLKRLLKFLLRR